jgi:lipoprotein-anchoring transpeptidase ErfK/SrfK
VATTTRLNGSQKAADNIDAMGRPLLLIALLLATACSSAGLDTPEPASEPATTEPGSVSTPPETVAEDARPVWPGFEASNDEDPALVALATRPLEIYEDPEGQEPSMILDQSTILGTVTVLAVLDDAGGWLEVMLPVRPNGSTGWVRSSDVALYVADGIIDVDLSDRRLTYTIDGVVVLETEVGVGSDYNETPTGTYFVTDRVTMSDPGGPWGPNALGLSARSDRITEFNGGDGIIGIHGTNNPASIGDNVSLGCIRVPNETIEVLHRMVPIGTRVTVSA